MSSNVNQTKKQGMNSPSKRDAKKAAVLGPEKKKLPLIPILIAVGLVVAGGILLFGKEPEKSPQVTMESASSKTVANQRMATQVTYAVSTFGDGHARHYEYQTDEGLAIKYFILKSSDGEIRAAFDACDVCWPAGKGYFQEGDNMVCRNCGRKFASILVNEVQGGCNPAPLNRKVVNGDVVIEVADILTGRPYFDFERKG